MILTATSSAFALLLSLQAVSADEQAALSAQGTAAQQTAEAPQEEITDRSHPEYIRCRRDSVVGSRAKKVKRCFTNREWEQIARAGNRGSRTLVGDLQVGMNQPGE